MEESSEKSASLEVREDNSVSTGRQAGSAFLADGQHCPAISEAKEEYCSPGGKETAVIAPVTDLHGGEQEGTSHSTGGEWESRHCDLKCDGCEKGRGDADSGQLTQEGIEMLRQEAFPDVSNSTKVCDRKGVRSPSGKTWKYRDTGNLPSSSAPRNPACFSVSSKTCEYKEWSDPDVEITELSALASSDVDQPIIDRDVAENQLETSSSLSQAVDEVRGGGGGGKEEKDGAVGLAFKENRGAVTDCSESNIQVTGAALLRRGKQNRENDSCEGMTSETCQRIESTPAAVEGVGQNGEDKVPFESDVDAKSTGQEENLNKVLISPEVDGSCDGQTGVDSLQHVHAAGGAIVSGSSNDIDPAPTSAVKTINEGVVSMSEFTENRESIVCTTIDADNSGFQSVCPANSAFRTLQKSKKAHEEETTEKLGSVLQADSAFTGASVHRPANSSGTVDEAMKHKQSTNGEDDSKCLESADSLLVQSEPASAKESPAICTCSGTVAPAADLDSTRCRGDGQGSGQRLTIEAASDESLDNMTLKPGSETITQAVSKSFEGEEEDVAECGLGSKLKEEEEEKKKKAVGSDAADVQYAHQSVRGFNSPDMRHVDRRSDKEERKIKEIQNETKGQACVSTPSAFKVLQKLAEDHGVQQSYTKSNVFTTEASGISPAVRASSKDLVAATGVSESISQKIQEISPATGGDVDAENSWTMHAENAVESVTCVSALDLSNCRKTLASSMNIRSGQVDDTRLKTPVSDVSVVGGTVSKLSEEELKGVKSAGNGSTTNSVTEIKSSTDSVTEIKSESDSVKDIKSASDSVTSVVTKNESSGAEESSPASSKGVKLILPGQKVIKIVSSSEKQANTSAEKRRPVQDSTVSQSATRGGGSDGSPLVLSRRKNPPSKVSFRPMSSNSRSLLVSAATASSALSSPPAGSSPAVASSPNHLPSSTFSPQETNKSQLTPVLMGSQVYLIPSSSLHTYPSSGYVRVPKQVKGIPVDLLRGPKQGQVTPRPELIKLKKPQVPGEAVSDANKSNTADASSCSISRQSVTKDSSESGIKILDVRSLAPVIPVTIDVSAPMTPATITSSVVVTVASPVTPVASTVGVKVSGPMVPSVIPAPVTSVPQSSAVTTTSSALTFAPIQAAVNTLMPDGGKRTILLTTSDVLAEGIASEGSRLVPVANTPNRVLLTKYSGSSTFTVTSTTSIPAQPRLIKPIPAASTSVSSVASLTPKTFVTLKQALTSPTSVKSDSETSTAVVAAGSVSEPASCHLTTPIYLLTSTCASTSPSSVTVVTPAAKVQNRILRVDQNNKQKSRATIVMSGTRFSTPGPDPGTQAVKLKLSQKLDSLPQSSALTLRSAPSHPQHISVLPTALFTPAAAMSTSQSLQLTLSATQSFQSMSFPSRSLLITSSTNTSTSMTSCHPQSSSVTSAAVHGDNLACSTKRKKLEIVEAPVLSRMRQDATDSSSASALSVLNPIPSVPSCAATAPPLLIPSFVSSTTSGLFCKESSDVPKHRKISPQKSESPRCRTMIPSEPLSPVKLKARREEMTADPHFQSHVVADKHGGAGEVELPETSRNSSKVNPVPHPLVVDAGAFLARESQYPPAKRPRILTSLLQAPYLENAAKETMTPKKKKKMMREKSSPQVYSTTLQTAQGSVPVMVMNPALQDSDSNTDSEDNDACDVSLLASQADMDVSLLTKMVLESERGIKEERLVSKSGHVVVIDEKPDSKEAASETCPMTSVQSVTGATAEKVSENEEKSTSVSETTSEGSALGVVGELDNSSISSQAGVVCGNEESETPACDDVSELGIRIESVFSIANLAESTVSENEGVNEKTPGESQIREGEHSKESIRPKRSLRDRPMPKCEKRKRMTQRDWTSSVVEELESAHDAYVSRERDADNNEEFLLKEECEGTERQKHLLSYNLHEPSEWKRACIPCYVVVERMSQAEIAAKERSSTSSKCSDHCRKRTLNCLCGLNLLACENHPDISSFLARKTEPAQKFPALSKVTLKTPPSPPGKEELTPGDDEKGSPDSSVETVPSPAPKLLQLSPKSSLLKLPSKMAKAKQQLSPVQCFQRDMRQLQKQVSSKRQEMKQNKNKRKRQAQGASAGKQGVSTSRKAPKKRRKPSEPTINGVPVDPLLVLSQPSRYFSKVSKEGDKQVLFASKTPLAGRRPPPPLPTERVEVEASSPVYLSPQSSAQGPAENTTASGDARNPLTKSGAKPPVSEAVKEKVQPAVEPNPTSLIQAFPPSAKPIPTAKIQAALKSLTNYVSATGRASSLQKGLFLLQIDGKPVLVTIPGPGSEGKPVKAVVLQNAAPGSVKVGTSSSETTQNAKNVTTQAVVSRTLTLTTSSSPGSSTGLVTHKQGVTKATVAKPHVSQPLRLVTQAVVNPSTTVTTSQTGHSPVTPTSQKRRLPRPNVSRKSVSQPPNASQAVSKTVYSSKPSESVRDVARLSESEKSVHVISTSSSTVMISFASSASVQHTTTIQSPMQYPALTTTRSVSRTRTGPPQMGPNNVQEIRVYPQSQRSITLIDNARRRSHNTGPSGASLPPGGTSPARRPSNTGASTVYGDRNSVLGHLPLDSKLLPQRKSKRELSPLTEQQRKAKRQKLEKKYPLPPGVIIKSEPDDNGHGLDSNWSVTSTLHSLTSSQGTQQSESSSSQGTTRTVADMNSDPDTVLDIPEAGDLPRLSPAPFTPDEPPSLTQEAPFPTPASPNASCRGDVDHDSPPVLQPMPPSTPSVFPGVDEDLEDDELLMASEPTTVSPRPSSLTPSASSSCSSLGVSSSTGASPNLALPPSSKNVKIQRLKELLKKKEQQLENMKKLMSVMGGQESS